MQILWCRKPGESDLDERLLTDRQDQLAAARQWAEANGYLVREVTIDITVSPDFTPAIK